MINEKLIKKILVVLATLSCIAGTFIAIMTYVNIGFSENFLSQWSKSLFFAIIFMLPLGGLMMFLSSKIIKTCFPNLRYVMHNILIGILMAMGMEAIMAVSTTLNIIGYINFDSFSSFWLKSYLAALPFALFFSPIITIAIKPKLEAYLKS